MCRAQGNAGAVTRIRNVTEGMVEYLRVSDNELEAFICATDTPEGVETDEDFRTFLAWLKSDSLGVRRVGDLFYCVVFTTFDGTTMCKTCEARSRDEAVLLIASSELLARYVIAVLSSESEITVTKDVCLPS